MTDESSRQNLVAGVTGPQLVVPLALVRAVNKHLPTAVMAQQAAFLSALKSDEGGWFHLPQAGESNPEGNFFEQVGSWEALGLGGRKRVSKIRDRLKALGVIETKRTGVPAREMYRVNHREFLEIVGSGFVDLTGNTHPADEYDMAAGTHGPVVPIPLALLRAVGNDIQAAMMLRQATFLTGVSRERGGWFHLPQTGEGNINGNLFEQVGSWEAIGLGNERKQRETRQMLEKLQVLETKREGVPARTFYRVNLDAYARLLEKGGSEVALRIGIGTKAATKPSRSDCAKRHNWIGQQQEASNIQIGQKGTTGLVKKAQLGCAEGHIQIGQKGTTITESFQRTSESNKESSSPHPPLPRDISRAEPADEAKSDDDLPCEVIDRLVTRLSKGDIKSPEGYINRTLKAEGIDVTRQRINAVMASIQHVEERKRAEEERYAPVRTLMKKRQQAISALGSAREAVKRVRGYPDPNPTLLEAHEGELEAAYQEVIRIDQEIARMQEAGRGGLEAG